MPETVMVLENKSEQLKKQSELCTLKECVWKMAMNY